MSKKTNNSTFRIGLTMSGAVSAGAYTAGVLDYFFETLFKWEQAKKNGKNVPQHEVKLEIMSGASAGGISSILSVLALKYDYNNNYITELKPIEERLLYKSWVEMGDEKEEVILQFLEKESSSDGGRIKSILNSQPIDNIGENAKKWFLNKKSKKEVPDFPNFVSKDLDLLCTITNLNGLEYNYKFRNSSTSSSSVFMHSGYFRYRFSDNLDNKWDALDLNDKKAINTLVKAAKSTSAFPLMLKARKTHVRWKYINAFQESLFPGRGVSNTSKTLDDKKKYKFISIDGGMTNNEPLGYTNKFLKQKMEADDDLSIILINPFPTGRIEEDANKIKEDNSRVEEKQESIKCDNYSDDLLCVLMQLIPVLRRQVMFSQEDLFTALDDEDTSRFAIAPVRKEIINGEKITMKKTALASGALSGFSGFFNIDFRKHDFYLGRKNCQDFLRFYFVKEYKNDYRFLQNSIDEEVVKDFQIKKKENKIYLPIIPDISFMALKESKSSSEKDIWSELNEDDINFWKEEKIKFPVQEYNKKYFNKLVKLLEKRLLAIAPQIAKDYKILNSNKQESNIVKERENSGVIKKGLFQIKFFLFRCYFYLKGGKSMSKYIINIIIDDFVKYGILKDIPNKDELQGKPIQIYFFYK